MKKVKTLNVAFENLEGADIQSKYIGHFELKDFKTDLFLTAEGEMIEVKKPSAIAIQIHKDANKEEYEHLQKWYLNENKKLFTRLGLSDISSISVTFEDGSSKSYDVPWEDYECDFNPYQKTMIDNFGHFYILITKEKKNIEEYFEWIIPYEECDWELKD